MELKVRPTQILKHLLWIALSVPGASYAFETNISPLVSQPHSYCLGYCVKALNRKAREKNRFSDMTLGIGIGSTPEIASAELAKYCSSLYGNDGKQFQLYRKGNKSVTCADELPEALKGDYSCRGACHLSEVRHHGSQSSFDRTSHATTRAFAYQNLIRACGGQHATGGHLFTLTADQRPNQICEWHSTLDQVRNQSNFQPSYKPLKLEDKSKPLTIDD